MGCLIQSISPGRFGEAPVEYRTSTEISELQQEEEQEQEF